MKKYISKIIVGLILVFPASAMALSINNKSDETALVIIKDSDFNTIEKIFVDGGQTHQHLFKKDPAHKFNVEVRYPVKKELSEAPEFHQDLSGEEKICVPQRLCQ